MKRLILPIFTIVGAVLSSYLLVRFGGPSLMAPVVSSKVHEVIKALRGGIETESLVIGGPDDSGYLFLGSTESGFGIHWFSDNRSLRASWTLEETGVQMIFRDLDDRPSMMVVSDDSGNTGISLRDSDLIVRDEDAKGRVVIGGFDGVYGISLGDRNEKIRSHLGIADIADQETGAFLVFLDENGKGRLSITTAHEGGGIIIYGDDGTVLKAIPDVDAVD